MFDFLYADIGDKINIKIDDENIDADYFINGIETEILVNGIIKSKWTLLEASIFEYHFFTLDDSVLGLLDENNVLGY